MGNPLVSVVIPAHNAERFLGEAIESVFAQTYAPVEAVVVDDGSSDATTEIASGYEGMRLIRNPESRGAAAARNAGVEAARGEILAFVDADDVLLPGKLEFQVDELLSRDDEVCVLASQEFIVEDGASIPMAALTDRRRPAWVDDEFPNVYTMTMVLRKSLFRSLSGFTEGLSYTEDVDFLFRLIEGGVELSRHREVVVRRRAHAGNMTQNAANTQTALFRAFKARIERHRSRTPEAGGPGQPD